MYLLITLQRKDESVRHDVDMTSDMLEYFALGTDVLLCNGHFVVEFLGMCLNKQWKVARAESSPALQTSCMWDCLVTIKTAISFLQNLSSQKNLCIDMDQLTLSCDQTQNITVETDSEQRCSSKQKAFKPWMDIMIQMLLDLCMVMFDDQFFPDCRTTAGMAIVIVIKIICTAEAFVPTVGKLIFPSHIEPGESAIPILDDPKIVSVFKKCQGVVSFSHLCLCRGVLTMVPLQTLAQCSEVILTDQSDEGNLMFDALFPDLCSLCDGLKESSSSLLAFRTLTLWASQARQIAVSGHFEVSQMKEKLHGTSPIPSKLLSYVWTHWDHPVEGVRYQTRMICEHVVNLHLIVAQPDSSKEVFLKDLTGSLLKVGWHVRGKYGPLSCITSVVGATKMLVWFPTIPQDIFPLMKDRSLVPHVMDFVDKMASCHKQEITETGQDIEAWLTIWMAPLLYHLQHGCRRMREHLAQYCLPKLLKCCPESLQYLVKHLQGSNEPNQRDLGTLVTCLKTARSSGLMSFNSESLESFTGKSSCRWCGVVPVELMRNALCHLDDQIRLAALGLLCDSPRTTESVTELDLQLLRVFIPANMNNQSPSFRQQAAAQLKKFFMRLKECIRICGKNVKQGKMIDGKEFYEHQLALYKEFLLWFSGFQFDSLFPGASSTRRTTALSNLMLIKQIFSLEESSAATEMDAFNITAVMTQDDIFILLDCLSDSYEHNKMMTYDILMAAPPQRLPFQKESSRHEWLDMIDRLVSSPRAVDASSAAMFLRLLVERCSSPLIFSKLKSVEASVLEQYDEALEGVPCLQSFRVLRYLIDLLRSHCASASKNLSLIGIQAPMHGVLYCLRSILSYTSLSSVAADEHWQNLMSCLVTECFYTADIVAPVITNESPEGFTSDDTQEAEGDFNEIPDQLNDLLETSSIKAPASQILLVCCWRTMKEVALLLGELAENAPLRVGNITHGLLTTSQLQGIGAFFTKVLLTSKHRGAFELAYTGFAKLCAVMWSSTVKDLCQLPEQWLQSLLDELTSAAPLQALCGTRRSAGVPFFIQAIVTTEPSAAGRACFKRIMRELLQIASKPVEENRIRDSTLPQVHACNILRALYRETKLGEDVFPFVSDGVVVAITGFHSESWAMRNSSTLLFSALVTRVFGVKRAKDEHSKKNCMTGREFFSRFPELHSFLLSQLQVACQGIDRENTTHPSLYPVLVILSRLYPSTMDGVDSVLNMAKFVPLVISCRKSMVIKTRMMSARAVVPLVSGDLFIQTLFNLVLSLPVSTSHELKQNHIHGTLVQIYHLLNGHVCDAAVSIKRQIVSDILPQLRNSAWLGTRNNPCALTRSVFLDVVLNFVVDWSWLQHTDSGNSELVMSTISDLQSLKQWFENMAIEETLNEQHARAVIGEVFVRKAVAGICLRACEDYEVHHEPDNPKITSKYADVIHALLQSSEYEVRSAVLEFVISHLPSDTSSSLDCEVAPDSTHSKTASWLLREMEPQFKTQLFSMAMKTEHHVDCLVKVFQVLSQLPGVLSFPWILSSGGEISASECWTFVAGLIDAPSQRDSLKCALLQFLSRMVSVMHGLVTSKDSIVASHAVNALAHFSRILLEASSPSESVELRICTAQVLGHINVTDAMFHSKGTLGGVPFVLWSVVVKLLCDDEPVVREQMALGFSMLSKRVPPSSLDVGCPVESCAVVPPASVEAAMQCVWRVFIHRAPVACVSWMMELIREDLAYEPGDQEDEVSDADRLFEKGPLNIYAEDCIITRIAFHTVEQGIDSNDGSALLALKTHKTELIDLLKDQLENYVLLLERLLSANRVVKRNCFGVFYRALAGLFVIIMLTRRLDGNISSIQSRVIAVIRALQKPAQTGGIAFHLMIKECVEKLRTLITL